MRAREETPLSENQARTVTVCLTILAAVALGAALYWLRGVLVPFALAVFISFSLTPLVDLLRQRLRMPQALALLAAIGLAFVSLALVGVLVSTSVVQMAQSQTDYVANLEQAWDEARSFVETHVSAEAVQSFDEEAFFERVKSEVTRFVGLTVKALNGILSQGFLVLMFVLFLLLGSADPRHRAGGIWAEIRAQSRRYISTKVTTSAVTGALTGLILQILGVQPALVFGTLAFLLNFIPSIGSVVATLLPVPVVLVSGLGLWTGILAVLLPGLVQFAVGNLIEPRVMGASLDLHPVTVMVALIFWGTLWGFVGALLATPITAVLKLVLERIEVTRPFAHLLAGRLGPEPEPA